MAMDTWYQDYYSENNQDSSTFGYMLTSTFLHLAFFATAILVGSLMPKPELPEVVEIEILSAPAPVLAKIPTPPQTIKPEPESKAIPSVQMPKVKVEQTVAKPAARSNFENEIASMEAAMEKELASAPPRPKSIKSPSKAIVKGPTAAISDVIAPTLETDEFEKSLTEKVEVRAEKFNGDELNDDFNKVDQEQTHKIAALKKSLDSETASAFSDNESELENLKNQQILADKALAVKNAQRYAGEIANIEKARADRIAAANAAAMAAMAKNRIRTLEELKQLPGNKRPYYESIDRLAGRQGEVSFLAYISKDGKPVQFKLIKSTGHVTLDKKTLQAIREWKFYPGQEGWVEIPFRWDLKGGPQEMPATLRRKISQF